MLLAIWANIILAVFNLIPIPPLDGSRIVDARLTSPQAIAAYRNFSQYGMLVLIGFLYFGGFKIFILPVVGVLCGLWDCPTDVTHARAAGGSGAGDGLLGDDRVLADLEVEHADAGEVGPVVEGELEPVARMDGPGGQDLERDPRPGHGPHELDVPLGRDAPDVVVVRRPVAIDVELHPLLRRRGGPVFVVVQGLHIEVRLDAGLLHGHRHFDGMAADAGEHAVGS